MIDQTLWKNGYREVYEAFVMFLLIAGDLG
jgi:hypothetical protein